MIPDGLADKVLNKEGRLAFFDFFKPKWKHSDWNVRLEAVRNVNDQVILFKVAKSDEQYQVREVAVKALTDQKQISEIAHTDKDESVREAAAITLKNQTYLKNFYKVESSYRLKEIIVERITDQEFCLAVFRENQGSVSLQLAALAKITDQAVLENIYQSHNDLRIRCGAIKRMSDKRTLQKISNANEDFLLHAAADEVLAQLRIKEIHHCNDLNEITKIAHNDPDWQVRVAAYKKLGDTQQASAIETVCSKDTSIFSDEVEQLEDKKTLEYVIKRTKDSTVSHNMDIRKQAQKRLDAIVHNEISTSKDVTFLVDTFRNADDEKIFRNAATRLDDDTLLGLIKSEQNVMKKQAAVIALRNQEHLVQLATSSSNWEIRAGAAIKVQDQQSLIRILQKDSSAFVRVAASQNLDKKDVPQEILDQIDQSMNTVGSRIHGYLRDLLKSDVKKGDIIQKLKSFWLISSLSDELINLAKTASDSFEITVKGAVEELCAIKTDASSNILYLVKNRDPILTKQTTMEGRAVTVTGSALTTFSESKKMAELELTKRVFENYSVKFYIKTDNLKMKGTFKKCT